MNVYKHYAFDFNGVYANEDIASDLTCMDCSQITGSRLFCSQEAEQKLKTLIHQQGIHGIHFLDSGDYHYITKLMCDEVKEPFELVVFDHHSDMKPPLFKGTLSCGDWLAQCINDNQFLQQVTLEGPSDIQVIKEMKSQKVHYINEQSIGQADLGQINQQLPVYLSIDKDLLTDKVVKTNWDQGNVSLEQLKKALSSILANRSIIGVDICGNLNTPFFTPQALKAKQLNQDSDVVLYQFIHHQLETA